MPERNYSSNSYASKVTQHDVREKLKPIVSGTKKEKTELEKAWSSFFSEGIRTVGQSVLNDTILPMIKQLISEAIKNGIDMMLFGKTNSSNVSNVGRVAYNKITNYPTSSRNSYVPQAAVYDYRSITVDSETKADEVLATLNEIIDEYHVAKVGEFYELTNQSTVSTDYNYGWTDLRQAYISKIWDSGKKRFVYKFNMPKVIPLKNLD